jgi:glycosyltransferase involved in cell wall biosynthesis
MFWRAASLVKLLFINTLYAPYAMGGAERVVQSLAEGITEAGHEAVVVATAPGKGTRAAWVNGAKVHYVGLRNLYWPFGERKNPAALKPLWHALDTHQFWMASAVDHILDTERPDLVHTHNLSGFSTLVWRYVKQRGLPLIHTLHDYYLLCPKATMFRANKNCRRPCIRCSPYALPRRHDSNLVDEVTGVSKFVLERHLSHHYFHATPRKEVIYNGYKTKVAASWSGTQSLPVRFGYLGRLDPSKGLEVLLDSVRRLPNGSWHLRIGGKGWAEYESHLRDKYEAPAIEFLGYVETDPFFEAIDVLVVPSVWEEPAGRIISEALSHGVPVIGSRTGGIPELVENERTGFVFDNKRSIDLAAKMRTCIEDPSMICYMRHECLKKAKRLLPEVITAQYLEAYAEVVRES